MTPLFNRDIHIAKFYLEKGQVMTLPLHERFQSLNDQWLIIARKELPEGANYAKETKAYFKTLQIMAEEALFPPTRTTITKPAAPFAWGLVIRMGHGNSNDQEVVRRIVSGTKNVLSIIEMPAGPALSMANYMMDETIGLAHNKLGLSLYEIVLQSALKHEVKFVRQSLARRVLDFVKKPDAPINDKEFGRLRHNVVNMAFEALNMPKIPYKGIQIEPTPRLSA